MSFALKSAQSKALRPAAASRRASVAVKAGKASMLQRWHTARRQQCSALMRAAGDQPNSLNAAPMRPRITDALPLIPLTPLHLCAV